MPRTYANPCTLNQLAGLLTHDAGVAGIEAWIEGVRGQVRRRSTERIAVPGLGYVWLEHSHLEFKAKQAFYDEITRGKPAVPRHDVVGAIARAFAAGHDAVVMPGLGTFFAIPRDPGPGIFVKLADDATFASDAPAEHASSALERGVLESEGEELAYAAAKLAALDASPVIGTLVERLEDKSPARRAHAALALHYLFHHGAKVPRGAAADALVNGLVKAAQDKNAEVRANALFAIAELDTLAQRASAVVVGALVDRSSQCREHAAYALLSLPAEIARTVPTILSLLRRETNLLTREHLVGALAKVKHKRIVPALIELLREGHDTIRTLALKALRAQRPLDRASRSALEAFVTESQADIADVVEKFGGRDKLDELGHEIVRARQNQIAQARKLLAP